MTKKRLLKHEKRWKNKVSSYYEPFHELLFRRRMIELNKILKKGCYLVRQFQVLSFEAQSSYTRYFTVLGVVLNIEIRNPDNEVWTKIHYWDFEVQKKENYNLRNHPEESVRDAFFLYNKDSEAFYLGGFI